MKIKLFFDDSKLAKEFCENSSYVKSRKLHNDYTQIWIRVELFNCSMDEVVTLLASKKMYFIYRIVVISETEEIL